MLRWPAYYWFKRGGFIFVYADRSALRNNCLEAASMLTSELSLQDSQRGRTHDACVLKTCMLPEASAFVAHYDLAMKPYSKNTKGKKGHKCGAPEQYGAIALFVRRAQSLRKVSFNAPIALAFSLTRSATTRSIIPTSGY